MVISDWFLPFFCVAAIGGILYHVIDVTGAAPTAPKFKTVSESTRRHVNNTKSQEY